MTVPLRVFVSHSAKEGDAIAVQEKLVARLTAKRETFTLLMDKSDLVVGDRWRARINFWIGSCDVAVVLLSPSALDSAYVAYEVSVLAYRAGVADSRFRIIPVYLKDVDRKRLEQSRLDPAKLTEIQRLANKTIPEEIADAVMEELSAIADAPPRPIDGIVRRAETLLDGVPKTVIENASGKLPDFELPWEPGQNAIRPLAERLLGVGMLGAIDALIELSAGMTGANVQELVNLVACTWVDMKAVDSLAKKRAVALNARNTRTANMYHLAASGGKPTWIFVPCNNNFAGSGATAHEMTEIVRNALCSNLKVKPADLDRQLQLIKARYVVLLALPGEGLVEDPTVVRALREAFPTVTFFFLTGNTSPEMIEDIAELIIPQLQQDEEDKFHDAHEELDANVLMPLRARGVL
jgi:hypothetical protein